LLLNLLVIDELGRNFTNAKNIILELARLLDETHQCDQCQISMKIKEMLKDKINEGKIREVDRRMPASRI
jgi:hypothetical protein